MKTIMVRYRTSEEHAAVNATLIGEVFGELRVRNPAGLRYASYRLADGVTFVHLAQLEASDGNPLADIPAFQAFQERLRSRCVEPPVVTELSALDSYEGARLS